jgi:S1-C subfamily serine protease
MSRLLIACLLFVLLTAHTISVNAQNNIPVAAPMNTESAGTESDVAIRSVMRVICAQQDSMGTGFLHKSGKIITAAHVVKDCTDPTLLLSNGTSVPAKTDVIEPDMDFAVIVPNRPIDAPSLTLTSQQKFTIGSQVSTWGFPLGYAGFRPMLSTGILSGQDVVKADSGKLAIQYVVNAAFNSGNSGGPLLLIETGEVLGVVVSKIAPLRPDTLNALHALQNQASGFMYTAIAPDGTKRQFSEGQVIALVLDDLRKQVQLVIGHAAMAGDLRLFLNANHIDP